MMHSTQFVIALAVALAVTAAFVDLRQGRIPNRLTYPVALVGIAMQGVLHGWRGLLLSLAGGALFGGVFLLFYIVHAMGAGDVKLAAALGCVVGLAWSVKVLFATGIAGGVLAIVFMVRSRRIVQTLRNIFSVVGFHARHGLQEHPVVNLGNAQALRMPYGLAFAAGTLYWAAVLLFRR